MSETKLQSDKFDENIAYLHRYIEHMKDHIVDVPVKIKKFDNKCERCQAELRRIKKRSDHDRIGVLKGQPEAILSFSTILCFLGMHKECCRDYVLEAEQIEVKCRCSCHDESKVRSGRKSKRIKNIKVGAVKS